MTEDNLDKKLIAIIAQDGTLFGKSLKQVDGSFFRGENQKIHKLLSSYYAKHRKLPSLDIIEQQIYKNRDKILGKDIDADSFLLKFRTEAELIDTGDFDFLVDEIRNRKGYDIIHEALPEAIDKAKNYQIEAAAEILVSAGNSMRASVSVEKVNRTSNHDYVQTLLNSYDEAKQSPDLVWGFKTGFEKLDKVTYGLDRGEMFLISARPGNGKSMFLLSVACNMFKAGRNVLYISIEMPAKQMWHRASACYSGMMINDIKEGTLSSEDEETFKKIMRAMEKKENRFEILDAPSVTPATVTSEIDQMIDKHKPDVVFVDYLGIMKADESGLQDNLAQASVVEGLRGLARRKNLGIFTAAQLNRPDKGKKKTQGLERLARSDILGATVDCALQVEEFDTEEELTKLSDKVKIIVIKNRKGPFPMSFDVKKDFSRGRFVDWELAGWGGESTTPTKKEIQ